MLSWNWASWRAQISSIELQRTGSVRSLSAFSNHEFFAKFLLFTWTDPACGANAACANISSCAANGSSKCWCFLISASTEPNGSAKSSFERKAYCFAIQVTDDDATDKLETTLHRRGKHTELNNNLKFWKLKSNFSLPVVDVMKTSSARRTAL